MLKLDHLPFGEAAVLERIGLIARLGEVARGELALVGDDQPAVAQVVDIGLQRRRVHRDQHVGLVAGGLDRGRAEIDLEGGDAEGRALRRADFGREIGEGGEVVAGERGRQGELPAGQLHAVAAVAGKADDDRFARRMGGGFGFGDAVRGSGHAGYLGRPRAFRHAFNAASAVALKDHDHFLEVEVALEVMQRFVLDQASAVLAHEFGAAGRIGIKDQVEMFAQAHHHRVRIRGVVLESPAAGSDMSPAIAGG